jgi:ribosomal protein S6--L-glutamate ligase
VAKIGLWFYRNEGGDTVLAKLRAGLQARGHDVFDEIDLRTCHVLDGAVVTPAGLDLTSLDVLYHMNADEQTAHQRDILRALALTGVTVLNRPPSYDRCQDKFTANLVLRKNGVRVPPAGLFPTKAPAPFLRSLLERYGTVVVKKRTGHGGSGITKLSNADDFIDFVEMMSEHLPTLYFEKFIAFGDKDYRVDLIDQQYVGGYRRKRRHSFKTNVHLGAEMIAEEPGPEQIEAAKAAARVLEIDMTIVDLLVGVEDKQTYVLEVAPILGVFTGAGLRKGVNTVQTPEQAHPIFDYDERKVAMLVEFLDRRAKGVTAGRNA